MCTINFVPEMCLKQTLISHMHVLDIFKKRIQIPWRSVVKISKISHVRFFIV